MDSEGLPILYSFRRCPYAIRARLAIEVSTIQVELREVLLSNKPKEMLACSAKGTVPILQLNNGTVIDESRDIMTWALSQNDPQNWLPKIPQDSKETFRLIELNDNKFKQHLDHYKYADRFPDKPMQDYRQQAEEFIQLTEDILKNTQYLINDNLTYADIAIFPFIRQFAYVDIEWFSKSKYVNLQKWLHALLESKLFKHVMVKHIVWKRA